MLIVHLFYITSPFMSEKGKMREAIWKLFAELGMSLFVLSSFDSDMKGCLLPYDGQENALTMEGDNFVLAKTPGRFMLMPSLS